MKKSLKITALAAAIAAVLPWQANAAGLGGINVFSALGQPLRAEIELHATPQELDGMTASVPSPDAFRRANLEYSSLMTDLQMIIERRGSRSVIRLSSSRVVNEPFMDVLVELRWSAGSLLREYTFLLDPVSAQPVAAVAPRATGASSSAVGSAPRALAPSGGHTVRRGETLHRIALDYLHPGAELEQMLIALLRENPDAFIAGNINRLRAGVSLNIPDEVAVAAIPAEDARREVLAQAADFEAYRNRVASAVAARPATVEQPVTRESGGQVTPRVEQVVRDAVPVDQVQVSGAPPSAEQAGGRAAVGVEGAESAGVAEEDIVALMREMREMRARMAELEQTVADQRGIIEIRDSVIARMNDQGVQEPDAPAATAEPQAPAPAVEPAPPAPAPAPAPAPMPAHSPSMVDSVMGNPLMLALGAAGVGLLALLGLRIARRRREESEANALAPLSEMPEESPSVMSQPGGESVDTDSGSSVMDTDFSQTGLSAIDADEGVDPVAEADVYLAYGRDAQAEEILLDALKVDGSRHAIYLKLLEVYVQRGDRRQFEVIATDLYSRTGGDGADWQKAAGMGRKLDPENPLYGEPAGASGVAAAAGVAGVAAYAAAADHNMEATRIGLDRSELDLPPLDDLPEAEAPADAVLELPEEGDVASADLEFNLELPETVDEAPTEKVAEAISHDDNLISFDLDLDDVPAKQAEVQPEPEIEPEPESVLEATLVEGEQNADETEDAPLEEDTVMDLERTEFDANLLDFDLDLSPTPAEKAAAPDMDLTSIDLDLDLPPATDEAPASEPPAAAPEIEGEPAAVPQFDAEDIQREMETKLELARAYDEMGDREGARELLEDVVNGGSSEQREEAQRMLERLA